MIFMRTYVLKKLFVYPDGHKVLKEKTYAVTLKQIESLVRKASRNYPVKEGWANLISQPRKSKKEKCALKGAKTELNSLWVKRRNLKVGTISIWVEIGECE